MPDNPNQNPNNPQTSGVISDDENKLTYHTDFKSSFGPDSEYAKMKANFISEMKDPNSEMSRVLRSNGIYRNRSQLNLFNAFHRFPRIDPVNIVDGTREYVFFVKPNLNIFETKGQLNKHLRNIPFFKDLYDRGYMRILEEWQNDLYPNRPFINILSNRKLNTVDLPTIQANEIETNANYMGTRIKYRRGAEKSDEEFDFSVEFLDTHYLEIYLMFKVYEEYQKARWFGLVAPKQFYLKHKILHDQMGLFKFIVADDGETILHWTQMWGVYPISLPRESIARLGMDDHHVKLNIQFKAQFVEDMDPTSITDFNILASKINRSNKEIPIWYTNETDPRMNMINGDDVFQPYIVTYSEASGLNYPNGDHYNMYMLKWR